MAVFITRKDMKKVYFIAGSALALILIESFILTKINHSNSLQATKESLNNEQAIHNQVQKQEVPTSRQPANENNVNEKNNDNANKNEKNHQELVIIKVKLKELKLCLSEQNCDFPQNDPKQYDIEVNQEIANQLTKLKEFTTDLELQNQILNIATSEFQSENGYVQQAALEIMSQLPIGLVAINAIESGLDNSSNPRIVEMSIEELKRYKNTDYQDQVSKMMSNMITNTGVFAAKSASDAVFSFITDQNLYQFESLYQKLAENTTVAKNIKAAIDEYKRLKSGG